jgi:uncharacterized membrane protein YgcG
MKKLVFKIIFIAIVAIGFTGCYTIIWSPDSQFPTEDNSSATIYYGDTYYGDYYYFYDTPWWWDYVPPVSLQTATGTRSDNADNQTLRGNGGRGTPSRVPEVQPPSHNAPPVTIGNEKGTKDTTGGSSSETVRSSSSSGSGSSSGSTSGGSSVRNNNGGRSSGGRR